MMGNISEDKITFSFGKNWEEFIKRSFSEERVFIAKKHILEFLELGDLKGKHFLDIGCGSGLSSLAAYDSGASKITSFDVDQYSVKTTEKLRGLRGNPNNWTILKGSILDEVFISSLEKADIVYSWGVLHHTGSMWKAIENASKLIKEDGFYYIALYTTNEKSEYWLKVKKKYNQANKLEKKLMEFWSIIRQNLIYFLRLKNPIKYFVDYKKNRGMSYFADVKDWLGGYPYEHAKIEEVFQFCRIKLGLELINIKTGRANTEYLFKKR